MIDMHCHSWLSDGSLTPKELAHKAKELGLQGICLTDHDTFYGCYELEKECRKLGLKMLWGIEVCAQHQGHYIHLLLYNVENLFANTIFRMNLHQCWEVHQDRAEKMFEQYRQTGLLKGNFKQVVKTLGDYHSFVHFAKVYDYHAKTEGISFTEARAIAKQAGIVKPKVYPSQFPEAIKILRLAKHNGATAALAHPGTIKSIKNELNSNKPLAGYRI